jgi:hypothetical protein
MRHLSSRRRRRLGPVALFGAAVLLASGSAAVASGGGHGRPGDERRGPRDRVEHVLLLSVDGMHQSDLDWYVRTHPSSSLAALVGHGVAFTNAQTPVPSDSFPGLLGQITGGNPRTTGVWYDDSWNPDRLPPGTTDCSGATPGTEVNYSEAADKDPTALDAGQGLAGLPDSILQMTSDPRSVIDPAKLPVDPATCRPVYPHEYPRVNTIFEVARQVGLRTAWSDKHAAYDLVNGPSGAGVQDLFTPEINSDAPTPGAPTDWTGVNALTQRYDHFKVQAVLNEIRGFDHSGATKVGTPAIFGMNFQSVSTAQKLPTSDGEPGGYLADGVTPGPVLRGALDDVDRELGAMRSALAEQHLDRSTAIVLSAKHGQSPQEPRALTRIPDGPILDGLNAAWRAAHPSATQDLVAFSIDDDAMVVWLNDRSPAATDFARQYLLSHDGTGNDINGDPKPYTASGLARVFAGQAAADFFGAAAGDDRRPDLYGVVQHGVVYTSKQAKIAEHGGADPQDRHVPLVVSGTGIRGTGDGDRGHAGDRRGGDGRLVETTQIAPTILELLGLPPGALRAVQLEHTPVLPLGGADDHG